MMEAMRQSWSDDRLDHLNRRVEEGFAQVDQRFEQVDQRFDQLEGRFC
jgi:tetrahydromethanopterin S-methyltransferase subunit G